jgi:hypothetical protein
MLFLYIECIKKMGDLGVSPKLIETHAKCIIMEIVNGVELGEYILLNLVTENKY